MIPPDPEGMNDDRAVWAGCAVREFIKVTRTEYPDALKDLLCDLRHWADREDIDWDVALDAAMNSYEEETFEPERETPDEDNASYV